MLIRPSLRMSITSIEQIDPDRYNVAIELDGKGSLVLEVQYFQSSLGRRGIRFDPQGLDEIRRVAGMNYPAIHLVAGGYVNKVDKGEALAFPIDVGDVSKLV
jgi:hypothetical protein